MAIGERATRGTCDVRSHQSLDGSPSDVRSLSARSESVRLVPVEVYSHMLRSRTAFQLPVPVVHHSNESGRPFFQERRDSLVSVIGLNCTNFSVDLESQTMTGRTTTGLIDKFED